MGFGQIGNWADVHATITVFGEKAHAKIFDFVAGTSDEKTVQLTAKMHKAIAIIQFKVESQIISRHPEWKMADRLLLDKVDYERGTVTLGDKEYVMKSCDFPTIDPKDPTRLTEGEVDLLKKLHRSFVVCEKLQRHMRFLLDVGSLYKISNNTLLFHGCTPLNADGSLKEVDVYGKTYKGKALYDVLDHHVREAFFDEDPEVRKHRRDLLWWLWLGEGSPLFAKSKMATFELYLIADKAARKEVKNSFYSLLEDEQVMNGILADFGMDPATSRMVCGHVPVKVKDGEDPVKCGGKVVIIDGGMSRAYQSKTGVAGFTLVKDEKGARLATHHAFVGEKAAVATDAALESDWRELG